MCAHMNGDTIDDELADEIHSVCRTTVGDELRSITYFTEDDVELANSLTLEDFLN